MHRVIIADDEPWVVYGISSLIDWEQEGFQVVGESFDGAAALSMIKELKPDVMISDIRMPGLDGLQLLNEIAEQRLDVEVILVSGYAEFEYAQQALRLGAFDYLLKPIEEDHFMETVSRLKDHLERKRQGSVDLDASLNELFDLLDSDSYTTIGQFVANKRGQLSCPHFRFINCIYPFVTMSDEEDGIMTMAGIQFISMKTGLNKRSFLVNYDEANYPIALLDFISVYLMEASHIGISPIGQSASSLSKMFHAADIALCSSGFYPEARVVQYKENEPIVGISNLMLQLELGIKEQRMDKIHEYLDQLASECSSQQFYVDQIASVYNQIISLIHKYYGNVNAFQEIEFLSYDQLARSYSSIAQLFDRLKSNFELEVTPEFPIVNEQVKVIMDFIDSSYTEDIMLGTIAKTFNLSLSYISYLIKKETGKYYSEYISSKRIALAKELLKESSLSVQEIVQQVGYKDYFHFNKLFKKHVGLTPSKFRKI